MQSFGSILKDSIDSMNLSINQFSKLSGINRGQIYNVFSGKKNISEDKFRTMLYTFNFTKSQKEALEKAFYRNLYGDESFDRIQFIIDNINKLSDKENQVTPVKHLPLLDKEKFEKLTFGKENIGLLIANIIRLEAENDAPSINTNIPFSFEFLDDTIYNSLCESKSKIDFKHIISFDKVGNSTHNLNNLFKSIKYLKIKYNVWYYYSEVEKLISPDNIFPYYFLSSNYLICIDADCNIALLITDEAAIKANYTLLTKATKKIKPLAYFPTNALDFKDKFATLALDLEWAHLSHFPCCMVRPLSSETLHEIGQKDLDNREWLINTVVNHYQAMSKMTDVTQRAYFAQTAGLKQFAKDGRFYEIPETFITPFPSHLIRDTLQGFIEDVDEKKMSIHLLKDEKIRIPKYLFSITLKTNDFLIAGYCSEDIKERYYGEF
ncbi:MAG: helix-turn-helix transcriptional regulator, partial [Oscillospiraceae bacterium]